jgi:hypothetical protein
MQFTRQSQFLVTKRAKSGTKGSNRGRQGNEVESGTWGTSASSRRRLQGT